MKAEQLGLLAIATLTLGCGGSGGGGGGGGGRCTPTSAAAITITAAGVAPAAVCVLPGGTVTFANQDAAPHDIEPAAGCAPLALGAIPAGETRTATMATEQTCAYHDALAPSAVAFQGVVAVTSAPAEGPGY